MKPTRRTFLAVAALAAATGCDTAPWSWFGPEAASFVVTGADPRVHHAIRRLTFGPRPGLYERVAAMGVDAFIDAQLAPDTINDRDCTWRVRRLETLALSPGALYEFKRPILLDESSRGLMLRAVYSERQLYEVMVEFWSDHFHVAASKGDCPWLLSAYHRDVIRAHALGNFRDLLRESALSPAMLWFLDGRVNRKAAPGDIPNENYARELMELHTLGVDGGYGQHDVMEVARCLTGWTVRPRNGFRKGRVEFKRVNHDDGAKAVLGVAIPASGGADDIDAVIAILMEHPATGRHIAAKLCRRFIGADPPEAAVAAVAEAFRASNGDIPETLRALYRTDAFWNAPGPLFKRPFHFVASALRAIDAETDGGPAIQEYLARMGHSPFQYPTPDGYPMHAEAWTGTLLWRWQFAAALGENRIAATSVPWENLTDRAGGGEALMSHLLGRTATDSERSACAQSGLGPACLLAAPAFQEC